MKLVTRLPALAANLRRIRKDRGLSQEQLAEAAGLSRVGYANIEGERTVPRTDSLARIASALGVGIDDLLRETRKLHSVRFRAKKKMVSREHLLVESARWLDDYVWLEGLLKDSPPFKFAAAEDTSARPDPRRTAEAARAAVGLKPRDAIRDLCGLLEGNGAKVFTPILAAEGFFGLSVGRADGGPAIVVNCWDRISVERWIFTAAHELGHLLLHHSSYDVSVHVENDEEEREADLFASHFLMPEELFDRELAEAGGLPFVEAVFKLKRMFKVSWKTVVYRLAERYETRGQGERKDVWRVFHQEYRRTTGRTLGAREEPDGLDAIAFSVTPVARAAQEPRHLEDDDFREDRLNRLVRTAVTEHRITMARAAEILRIDVSTMRAQAKSWSMIPV
jgi:Zn-dependent peptidase ImmA (M78 family)/DNA-binding XRE family transcriptional regulator